MPFVSCVHFLDLILTLFRYRMEGHTNPGFENSSSDTVVASKSGQTPNNLDPQGLVIEAVVTVRNAVKRYGEKGREIIRNLDMTVPRGSM